MRYRRGSLNLNNLENKAILKFVADSRYVTHAQLFRFAQLDYYERSRPILNWRIRRMVDGGLVRKQALPMLHCDALYSIARAGLQALERLGISTISVQPSTASRTPTSFSCRMRWR